MRMSSVFRLFFLIKKYTFALTCVGVRSCKKKEQTERKRELLNMKLDVAHKKMLVALSGGADSVALLHMLVKQGVSCVVAHCNFHLRGAESDRDEAFVRTLCGRLGVECVVKHFDTTGYAAQTKQSIEMAARELRYRWFDELLEQHDLPCVAVAHHADDNVETFVLNLVRGTGIRGLCGMKKTNGQVVRPLLGCSREYIESYCTIHGLDYVTDSTNNSDDYTRNRIRHHIVPVMKEMNPSFLETMNANMSRLESVYNLFRRQYANFVGRAVVETPSGFAVGREELSTLDEMELFLFELLHGVGFTSDSVEKIADCVREQRYGRQFDSREYRLLVDRTGLIVSRKEETSENFDYEIAEGTEALEEPIKMKLTKIDVDDTLVLSRSMTLVHLDYDKLTFPLVLRRWRRGDTFTPIGMKGAKKLSDFFVDIKMNRYEKEQTWLLVTSADEIVWVVGRRISDKVKYTGKTKRILQIELL